LNQGEVLIKSPPASTMQNIKRRGRSKNEASEKNYRSFSLGSQPKTGEFKTDLESWSQGLKNRCNKLEGRGGGLQSKATAINPRKVPVVKGRVTEEVKSTKKLWGGPRGGVEGGKKSSSKKSCQSVEVDTHCSKKGSRDRKSDGEKKNSYKRLGSPLKRLLREGAKTSEKRGKHQGNQLLRELLFLIVSERKNFADGSQCDESVQKVKINPTFCSSAKKAGGGRTQAGTELSPFRLAEMADTGG